MLIIFDCDGVLVDSEQLAARIFSEALVEIGIAMDPAACFATFRGLTLRDCYAWLEKNHGYEPSDAFHHMLEQRTRVGFAHELRSVPNVMEVLAFLDEVDISYCVASNGGHRKIKNSLDVTGLLPHFRHRFSAEDVPRGKPDPALFQYAARQMGVAETRCVVVEDSTAGLAAAQAAQMQALFFNPHGEAEVLGVQKFSHMRHLPGILQQIRQSW